MSETQTFNTDVARLLDIVANALYSNRDVFLRELISNAADACDRLRYEALQNPALTAGKPGFKVRVLTDAEARTLEVADNGVGMNRDDLVSNLGTIARSGTAALMESAKDPSLSLIGRFGVGFYASFMVADKVSVISRRAGEDQAWMWESDGRTGFTVREASAEESARLTDGRGTSITLHIKGDAFDMLLEDKLREIIRTYSDHIGVPVYLGAEDKPVNAASALWTRPKSEITAEQYKEFYHHIGHAFDDPLLTAHWKAEGKIEYTALLYVPSLRPWDMYDPGRKQAVRLYVRRVFITDQAEGLVYPWLRFLRGVIDSADLPLNISREMLQRNPLVATIRRGVTKKILSELDALSRSDRSGFEAFWLQFGAVVKEGLYDAADHREDIFKICRFRSTHEDGALASLEEYISRMKPGQDAIYYITGENLDTLKNSPQLEGFRARGLEVLFFTDTIDSFWLQMAPDYQGKKFASITKGTVNLDKFEAAQDKPREPEDAPALQKLLESLRAELKDEVGDVRLSNRLTDSPVCLVADEKEVDMHMERVLKIHQQYDPKSKRVLEINGGHPLIRALAGMAGGGAFQDAAHLLMDQARIIQGEPVPDPAAFARRMASFMEKSLAA